MTEKAHKVQTDFETAFEKTNHFFDRHPVLSKEIVTAKEEYFSKTGKIRVDDADFDNRMNAFLSWFIFDWKSSLVSATPIDYYLEYLENREKTEEAKLLKQHKTHTHSLFCFIKNKNGQTIIKDIYSGKKYIIVGSNLMMGHDKSSFFETRIFYADDIYFFGNYFIYHPVLVNKEIRKKIKQMKRLRKPLKPFLIQLHSFHTKWTKYRNINIKSIYHFDKSIPEAK